MQSILTHSNKPNNYVFMYGFSYKDNMLVQAIVSSRIVLLLIVSKSKMSQETLPRKILRRFSEISLVLWIKGRLTIFCTYTSTHDFRCFVDNFYSKFEKIFWFIGILISTGVASTLLWYSLYISADTPTVTIVESTHYPTYKIPFPGVTVCNVNKISKKAIIALAKEL